MNDGAIQDIMNDLQHSGVLVWYLKQLNLSRFPDLQITDDGRGVRAWRPQIDNALGRTGPALSFQEVILPLRRVGFRQYVEELYRFRDPDGEPEPVARLEPMEETPSILPKSDVSLNVEEESIQCERRTLDGDFCKHAPFKTMNGLIKHIKNVHEAEPVAQEMAA
jgi:hypothetical protein